MEPAVGEQAEDLREASSKESAAFRAPVMFVSDPDILAAGLECGSALCERENGSDV